MPAAGEGRYNAERRKTMICWLEIVYKDAWGPRRYLWEQQMLKRAPLLFCSCCRGTRHIRWNVLHVCGIYFTCSFGKQPTCSPQTFFLQWVSNLKKHLEDDWEYLILSHSERTNQICVLWWAGLQSLTKLLPVKSREKPSVPLKFKLLEKGWHFFSINAIAITSCPCSSIIPHSHLLGFMKDNDWPVGVPS